MFNRKTGFFYDELCMWHDPGNRGMFDAMGLYFQPFTSFENPETKRRIRNLLEVSGVIKTLECRSAEPATEADILNVHSAEYIKRLAHDSEQGPGDAASPSNISDGAPYSKGAYDIAKLSAGLAKSAVEQVMKGELKNAYVLTRPPGHHAKRDGGCGFCLLGNIAIAIESARTQSLVSKVAVIDWDVHHGNGTQDAFYENDEVLTISIHHDNNFPLDSGAHTERGAGKGHGYNLNIPLPAGSGIGAYMATLDQLVIPALERFQPDLIVVACGYDAAALDPLGPMILDSEAYREMMLKIMEVAAKLCEDKVVVVHEGGYSETYVPICALALIEAMSGQTSSVKDYVGEEIRAWGQQELMPHQQTLLSELTPYLQDI
ncbi:class II histone deacetylase [Marinomonas sp. CT5]|uniref:class II histone deacetylase n=1 Tax=Marinomonas sp. CT5 TaxID=2066133 RepID=UPI001BAFBD91|nr:class II histone deacetylase [Marinomonas sp. CT5]QUX97526.1 class II histone deacetylase [Marinomonas sp. CT5]